MSPVLASRPSSSRTGLPVGTVAQVLAPLRLGEVAARQRAKAFIPADSKELVGGIAPTPNRLVVANGPGFATVYDRPTGEQVAQFSNGRGDRSIVNDVVVAPNGDAYLTEFLLSKIYRIPAKAIARPKPGVQRLRTFVDFRGTAFPVEGRSANGIAVTSDGRFLIVGHFADGRRDGGLYRVRISNGQVTKIRLHGRILDGPDGIELTEANVLYVVEAIKRDIAEVRLNQDFSSGRLVSRTTSPRFQCPTGVAIADDRLLVTNSQFCGPGEPPFTVASIPIP